MEKNTYVQPRVETTSVKCPMVMQTVSNPALNMGSDINDADGD